MVPIDGPRRSKRTFAGSWEPTEPVDFDKLMRVPGPLSRSKTSVQGKVADVFTGGDGRRRLMSQCCCITTAASVGGSATPAGTI